MNKLVIHACGPSSSLARHCQHSAFYAFSLPSMLLSLSLCVFFMQIQCGGQRGKAICSSTSSKFQLWQAPFHCLLLARYDLSTSRPAPVSLNRPAVLLSSTRPCVPQSLSHCVFSPAYRSRLPSPSSLFSHPPREGCEFYDWSYNEPRVSQEQNDALGMVLGISWNVPAHSEH